MANGEQALLQKNRRSKARSLSAAFPYAFIFRNLRPKAAPANGCSTTQTELFAKTPLPNHRNASFCAVSTAEEAHRRSKEDQSRTELPAEALTRMDKMLLPERACRSSCNRDLD